MKRLAAWLVDRLLDVAERFTQSTEDLEREEREEYERRWGARRFMCGRCGGDVRDRAGPGRFAIDDDEWEIPVWFVTRECYACGERYMTVEEAAQLERMRAEETDACWDGNG